MNENLHYHYASFIKFLSKEDFFIPVVSKRIEKVFSTRAYNPEWIIENQEHPKQYVYERDELLKMYRENLAYRENIHLPTKKVPYDKFIRWIERAFRNAMTVEDYILTGTDIYVEYLLDSKIYHFKCETEKILLYLIRMSDKEDISCFKVYFANNYPDYLRLHETINSFKRFIIKCGDGDFLLKKNHGDDDTLVFCNSIELAKVFRKESQALYFCMKNIDAFKEKGFSIEPIRYRKKNPSYKYLSDKSTIPFLLREDTP